MTDTFSSFIKDYERGEKRCLNLCIMMFFEELEKYAKEHTTCDCENCLKLKENYESYTRSAN